MRNKYFKYNSYKNTGWTIDRLLIIIVEQNPCISYKDALEKATLTFNELNNLNNKTHYNNKKYFKYNLPFSYFEDDENFLEFFDIQK